MANNQPQDFPNEIFGLWANTSYVASIMGFIVRHQSLQRLQELIGIMKNKYNCQQQVKIYHETPKSIVFTCMA